MSTPLESPKSFPKRCLAFVQSTDPFATPRSTLLAGVILVIWLILVIFITTRHEFWRDEVRALSLARAATSPMDLYGLIQYEGHPILWYLLLYIGKSIVDIPLILPIISITIAFSAVVVFVFFAPFPFWIKCLFIFSTFPIYEYSVMARNYGISMLLLFIGAVLYQNRTKHPLLLAFILVLLSNTNVYSAILVCLIAVLWAWDTIIEQRTTPVRRKSFSLYLPFLIVFAGVLLCLVFAFPRGNTILPSVDEISIGDLVKAFIDAVLRPNQTFFFIVPEALPPLVASLLLYLAVFGFLHRPIFLIVALGSLITFGVFFRVIYAGYRHQGLFLIFLLFLYWLFIESMNNGKDMTRTKHLFFNLGFYIAIPVLILGSLAGIRDIVWADITMERSSSKALGEFLDTSGIYQDAIIVPEPDYFLESLPYYAQNQIYLPREHRFGTTMSWTTEADEHLYLGELLSIAHDLEMRYDQPVLIVLGHPDLYNDESDMKEYYSYNKIFEWSADELVDFYGSTILVAEFNSAYGDENYWVYAIK